MPAFRVRGIVEGFYGRPWSHEARREVLTLVAERGMNAYVYAPKDEPKHRHRWREPYTPDELAGLVGVAEHCRAHGIRFGFAISPGLDIAYDGAADRRALLAKLLPFADAGIDWYLLALDDIPVAPGLAARQAALAEHLLGELRDRLPGSDLALCPTEYLGTQPTPYLADLGAALPDDVDVFWTGPTVCSPSLRAADASAFSAALGGRSLLVWDNYPVNDGTMEPALHLGPYRGRDPRLATVVAGVLCNPMSQARASAVALATAAEFLADPEAYDAEAAWDRALRAIGGGRAAGLGALARACADSPLHPPDELELAGLAETVAAETGGPGWITSVAAAAAILRDAAALPATFPADDPDDPLGRELAPWAAAAAREAGAGLAALELLQLLHPAGSVGAAGEGRALAPDVDRCTVAVFTVLFCWMAARRSEQIAFGPRFKVVPGIVPAPGAGSSLVDLGLTLLEDRNVIDRLCRIALEEYQAWTPEAGAAVRAFVDGEEREVGPGGAFDATGTTVLLRAGRAATRLEPGVGLPFADPRLR